MMEDAATVATVEVAVEKRDASSHYLELEFNPTFAFIRQQRTKSKLEWKDLTVDIKGKRILHGVTGHVQSGDLTALMGPSGAGKSTTLNYVAGRLLPSRKTTLGGQVLFNGEQVDPVKHRKNIAYVLQHESLFATATAREALEFSAELRLPKSVSKEERGKLVDDLLESLGLSHVQDTMCGSEMVRGLSGGERKRVSIGIELITSPKVLFLDEPTSGLDSTSAFKVVKILKALANAGCAVLCTIHQPSSEVFDEFTSALLLSKGQVVFNGPTNDLRPQFRKMGFPIRKDYNVADGIMLVAQMVPLEELPSYNVDGDKCIESGTPEESNADSDIESGGAVISPAEDEGAVVPLVTNTGKPGMLTQALRLSAREFRNVGRDPKVILANLGVTVFLNLLFGAIFYQSANRDKSDYNVNSAFGALAMVFISAMFGSAQTPLLTFPMDRAVMLREYQTNTYGALPYLLSKLAVELPTFFLTALCTMLVTYWLIGFQSNFIFLTLEIWLLMLASVGLAMIIGAAAADANQASQFAPMVLVPQILFAGVFINTSLIPEWLRWLQYVSALKYGLNLGMISEFGDCDLPACENLLDINEVNKDQSWLYILILLCIFAVFRLMSLGVLVYRSRYFSN